MGPLTLITSGLLVIRPKPMPSAKITSYKSLVTYLVLIATRKFLNSEAFRTQRRNPACKAHYTVLGYIIFGGRNGWRTLQKTKRNS